MKYYSQINQDEYYINNISKEKRNGFYLDVGANDGLFGSNTATLEYYYDWTGICIEANPELIDKLIKNRPRSTVVHKAAYNKTCELNIEIPLEFEKDIPGDQLGRISGISDIDKRNENYFKKEFQGKTKKFIVEADTISNILQQIGNNKIIDYMSLDTEGVELEALEGIDFNNTFINFMTIEHGNRPGMKEQFIDYLISRGYEVHRINKWDIEFIKKS